MGFIAASKTNRRANDCENLQVSVHQTLIPETRTNFKVEDSSLMPLVSDMDTVPIYKKTKNYLIMICTFTIFHVC